MSKQTFHLPTWRRKPTADEAAPDIADSELVPSESAARPTRHKHGKRTYVIGGALLALAIAAAIIIPGAAGVGDDDGAGGASTTLTRPDGDPSGQTAEDNIYITTGVMYQETYRSETTGETKAKVGFIDYNQAVHNVRVVTSDSVFTEAISTSMFVKLGEQKYFKDGAILVRKASSISGDTATWSDQIVAISQQDYRDAYGQDPRNLSNYVISRDTVQNPSMTANDDGTYTLTFDLEPAGASAYYRHQVRTYSGAAKNPEFTAVHMVWTIDANWDLLQMDTVESYTVSMSGLGSLNCTSTLTEVFTDFGAVTDDQTEFQHYLETEYDPNNLGKLSDGGQDTQAMVRDFFRRTPNYSITVTANGQSYGLTAHVDIDQTAFQVRGNVAGVDLFAAYSNERVYVAFGSQKIVLRATDTIDAARTVAGYLGVQIPNISLDAAGMTALTKNVAMQETDTGMTIRLNDPMISGTVLLTDPDALRLTRADVALNFGGARMHVTATPYYGGFQVQSLEGYTDLTGALSLVSPLMDAATAKTATFHVALSGPLSLTGTATVTKTSGGYDAALTTTVDGVTVTAEYIGSTVYVSAGNIHVSGTGSEIKDLVAWAGKLAGATDAAAAGNAYAQFFRELTPQSAVDSIQDLAWSNNALHAQLNIAGNAVSAALSANSVTVTASGWTVRVTITGTSGSATTLHPTNGNYVTLSQLQPFAPVLERYVGAQAMGMDATVSVNGYSLDTDVVLSLGKPVAARAVSQILGRDLTVTFWNDRVYIDYGWHHVEASMNSLERALYAVLTITPGVDRQTVQNAIEAYTYFFEHLSFANVVGAISAFGYADGALNITANIAASPLYISLTPSQITLRTQVDSATLAVTATPGSAYASAPDLTPQGGSYRNLDDFLALFG